MSDVEAVFIGLNLLLNSWMLFQLRLLELRGTRPARRTVELLENGSAGPEAK